MEKTRLKIFSIFLVALFFLFLPIVAQASNFYISPITANYSEGDRVSVDIKISGSTPLNAASGVVVFPPETFAIESISKSKSVFNFWVTEPSFSKTTGAVSFEGVHISGSNLVSGTVLTVNLKVLKSGAGSVIFKSGQIFANDGQGTDITSNLSSGAFVVSPRGDKPAVSEIVEKQPEEAVGTEITSAEILIAPEISLGKQEGLPAVIGKSQYSQVDVLLTFNSLSGSKIFITGTTDHAGDFSMIVPQVLRSGPYFVSAVIFMNDGTHSPSSNVLDVKVDGSLDALSELGTPSYIALGVSFLLILLVVYVILLRYLRRGKNSLPTKRAIDEAENILHKSFDILRQDAAGVYVKNKMDGGKSASSGDSGVGTEEIAGLKKDLDEAEKLIEKEIEDLRK